MHVWLVFWAGQGVINGAGQTQLMAGEIFSQAGPAQRQEIGRQLQSSGFSFLAVFKYNLRAAGEGGRTASAHPSLRRRR
ncbi:hypothetical protein ABW13_09230 [Pluralibacter gergoviae]|nr:hypothetical protein ABW13_09230 [Pluralibacter gergoviae]